MCGEMSKEIVETREAASADNKAENLSVSVWDSMRPENKRVTEKQAKSEEKSEAKTTVDFPSPDKIADGSTTKIEVNVEGTVRNIFMHVPKNYDESKPTPVVVVFNGWGDKPGPGGTKAGAAGLEALTGLSAKADEKNFFVLYMSGNPKKDLSYNNGQYPFSKTDDVGYTTAVLEALNKNYNIDNERITLTGYSQGASFAHRAAAELPEKFRPANLVDVSGWTTGKEKPAPEGMNFLSIQSQEDHVAPVDGVGSASIWTLKRSRLTAICRQTASRSTLMYRRLMQHAQRWKKSRGGVPQEQKLKALCCLTTMATIGTEAPAHQHR